MRFKILVLRLLSEILFKQLEILDSVSGIRHFHDTERNLISETNLMIEDFKNEEENK